MLNTVVTRRTTLRLIGGSAAAAVLGFMFEGHAEVHASGQQAEGAAPLSTLGTVVSASADRLQVSAQGEALEVIWAESTRAYAGVSGRVADFAGFLPGDRVAVTGARGADGTVTASGVGSVFQPARATITGIDASGVAGTTLGQVDLHGHLPDSGQAILADRALRVGDVIVGYTWVDPSSRQTYLVVP